MKLLVHRLMRKFGVSVQRSRDPYVEIAEMLQGTPARNIVDGGAHYGSHAACFLQLWPSATVHAFEPQPDTLARLKQNFTGNSRVRIYGCALAESVGEAQFHINEKNHTSSLLETLEPDAMHPAATATVPLTSLDAWCVQEKLPPPEVIKLDLQGHELAALRGAQKSLAGVKAIVAEVNFYPRYTGSCLAHEVTAFLYEHGFRMYRLYEIISSPNGGWQQADALYVKSTRAF
jgi:FkbM family methyltransferase